jgi:MoxR-like ATPase
VQQEGDFLRRILAAMETVVVGQRPLVERILVALLANGHLLIEGVPGLAKTTVVKTLASLIDARFQRIQFTPDLLPADLVGTLVYNPRDGSFSTRKGPIFANIVLADEINRAPAKVHSAQGQRQRPLVGEGPQPGDLLRDHHPGDHPAGAVN